MRVAALDDDVDQLELTKYTLQAVGHDCHVFQDGDSLLRELRRESYDLLVLDWSLPDITGPEIVQWIRDNLTERIPILFLTNRREERDIVEGRQMIQQAEILEHHTHPPPKGRDVATIDARDI